MNMYTKNNNTVSMYTTNYHKRQLILVTTEDHGTKTLLIGTREKQQQQNLPNEILWNVQIKFYTASMRFKEKKYTHSTKSISSAKK